jgi:hypothetical protein
LLGLHMVDHCCEASQAQVLTLAKPSMHPTVKSQTHHSNFVRLSGVRYASEDTHSMLESSALGTTNNVMLF